MSILSVDKGNGISNRETKNNEEEEQKRRMVLSEFLRDKA